MTDSNETERLRELLDERGVEWRVGLESVTWVGDWCFVEYENGKLAATCEPTLTPEQAIAATLGAGECENVSTFNEDGLASYHFTCSECGLSVCASMGICETELHGPRSFGWKMGRYEFERCPRCGKAVKR